MPLLAIGLNHQTAAVSIREQFFVPHTMLADVLLGLQKAGIAEAVLLSTCNRTELYCMAEHSETAIAALCQLCHVDAEKVADIWYIYHDQAALRHLVAVAAGLNSMILGEPQILGQVKEAYAAAQKAHTVGKVLHQTFQYCFSLAKKVRSETHIGKNPVSVAFAASTLAKHIFADPAECKITLVGAGNTIELTARHFQKQGVQQFNFVNRTMARAAHLAEQFHGSAFALSEMTYALAEADIIVTATESQQHLITYDLLEKITAHHTATRPILLLDLSVPRNIEPKIAKLADCYLYGIDDLQSIVLENFEKRRDAAKLAEEIITHEVEQFFIKQKNALNAASIHQFNAHMIQLLTDFEQDIEKISNADEVIKAAKKLTKAMQHQLLKFLHL